MVMPGSFPSNFLALQNLQFGPSVIFLAKFAIAWPFAYHLLNGIRHLVRRTVQHFSVGTKNAYLPLPVY